MFVEGSEGEEPMEPPSAMGTAVPSLQPPPTFRPHKTLGSVQRPARAADQVQNKNPKKRRISSTESSDDEDVDMNMEGNSSSGSSVDPDEFPAKRLRTSTIVTRGSKSTSPQTATSQNGRSHSIAADDELPGVDTEDEFPGFNTEDEVHSITTDDMLTESANTSDVDDHHPRTPTPPLPSPPPTDVDPIRQPVQDTGIPDGTTPLPVPKVDNLQLGAVTGPPSSRPMVPDFLVMGKYDIYKYLTDVEEPGFKALLNTYVTFELADRSGIRGSLSTDGRPKAVTWWSSRARPDKFPPYDSFSSFTSNITKWWVSLQPDWRKSGFKCGKTSRKKGNFMSLYQPGVNGLLNIVILAYWWASILGERSEPASAAYHWLVTDTTWVLSQLTCVANDGFGVPKQA